MLLEKMQQYGMSILKNKKIFTRNYYKCKILIVILIILMVFTGCRQERNSTYFSEYLYTGEVGVKYIKGEKKNYQLSGRERICGSRL